MKTRENIIWSPMPGYLCQNGIIAEKDYFTEHKNCLTHFPCFSFSIKSSSDSRLSALGPRQNKYQIMELAHCSPKSIIVMEWFAGELWNYQSLFVITDPKSRIEENEIEKFQQTQCRLSSTHAATADQISLFDSVEITSSSRSVPSQYFLKLNLTASFGKCLKRAEWKLKIVASKEKLRWGKRTHGKHSNVTFREKVDKPWFHNCLFSIGLSLILFLTWFDNETEADGKRQSMSRDIEMSRCESYDKKVCEWVCRNRIFVSKKRRVMDVTRRGMKTNIFALEMKSQSRSAWKFLRFNAPNSWTLNHGFVLSHLYICANKTKLSFEQSISTVYIAPERNNENSPCWIFGSCVARVSGWLLDSFPISSGGNRN